MPFQSEKQRRWMHANEPEMAREWEEHSKADEDYDASVQENHATTGPEPVYGKMEMVGKFEAEAYPAGVQQLIAQLPLEEQAFATPADHRPTPTQAAYTTDPSYPGRCITCDHAVPMSGQLRCSALRGDPMVGAQHRCVLWTGAHEPQVIPAQRLVVPMRKAMMLEKARDGAGPLFETPEMPDYQDIYRMSEEDPRQEDESDAKATRRRAGTKRFRGLAGIHGESPVPELSAETYDYDMTGVKMRKPKRVERKRLFASGSPDLFAHEPEYQAKPGLGGTTSEWAGHKDSRDEAAKEAMCFLEEDEAKKWLAYHGIEKVCSVLYVNRTLAEVYGVPMSTWICVNMDSGMMMYKSRTSRLVFKPKR